MSQSVVSGHVPKPGYRKDDVLRLEKNPLKWSLSDVVDFIKTTDCAHLARIFKEQVRHNTHTHTHIPKPVFSRNLISATHTQIYIYLHVCMHTSQNQSLSRNLISVTHTHRYIYTYMCACIPPKTSLLVAT